MEGHAQGMVCAGLDQRGRALHIFSTATLGVLWAPQGRRSPGGEEGAGQAARAGTAQPRAFASLASRPGFARAFPRQPRAKPRSSPAPGRASRAASAIRQNHSAALSGGKANPHLRQGWVFTSSRGIQESSTCPQSVSCAWLKIISAFVSGAD